MLKKNLVICVKNTGYEASLVLHRVHTRIPDARVERHGEVRVIDEDKEDYIFPASFFVPFEPVRR